MSSRSRSALACARLGSLYSRAPLARRLCRVWVVLSRVVSCDKGKSREMALPLNIDDLIHQRKVESARIEYKKNWNPEKVLHSVCAFANDIDNWGGGYIRSRFYRNRRIGEFLKELDLAEGRNTGIGKIVRAMRENGSPPLEGCAWVATETVGGHSAEIMV